MVIEFIEAESTTENCRSIGRHVCNSNCGPVFGLLNVEFGCREEGILLGIYLLCLIKEEFQGSISLAKL